jgi:uncharacterized protein YigA (DUF484 family)
MDPVSLMSELAPFGSAGLMGAMWLWERRHSALRDQQLTEAHARISRDEQRLGSLTRVIEQNTAAIARFAEVQRELVDAIRGHRQEAQHEAA